MLICIAPDKDGKFGFNVKVGFTLRFATHGRTDSFSHRLWTGRVSLSLTLFNLSSKLVPGWSGSEDASFYIQR